MATLGYRLEKSGFGPFHGGAIRTEYRIDDVVDKMYTFVCLSEYTWRTAHKEHPCPMDDGIMAPRGRVLADYMFGCEDLADLIHWFPEPVLRLLAEAGYKVVSYSIDDEDLIRGSSGTQIAFDRCSRRVAESSILETFSIH